MRRQACGSQCYPAPVGVSDQHRTPDAAHVQLMDNGAGVGGKPGGRLRAGAVSRPVGRDDAELGGQPSGYQLPVGGRPWLPVQEYQVMTAQLGIGLHRW